MKCLLPSVHRKCLVRGHSSFHRVTLWANEGGLKRLKKWTEHSTLKSDWREHVGLYEGHWLSLAAGATTRLLCWVMHTLWQRAHGLQLQKSIGSLYHSLVPSSDRRPKSVNLAEYLPFKASTRLLSTDKMKQTEKHPFYITLFLQDVLFDDDFHEREAPSRLVPLIPKDRPLAIWWKCANFFPIHSIVSRHRVAKLSRGLSRSLQWMSPHHRERLSLRQELSEGSKRVSLSVANQADGDLRRRMRTICFFCCHQASNFPIIVFSRFRVTTERLFSIRWMKE